MAKKKKPRKRNEFLGLDLNKVDKARDKISYSWTSMNENLDKFFASQIDEDESNESYIRMNLVSQVVDGEGASSEYNLRVRTDFPNTSKDVKLIIEKEGRSQFDDENSSLGGGNVDSNNVTQGQEIGDALEDTSYSAAGRIEMIKKAGWKIYSDFGLRFDVPLDPFYKFRLRKRFRGKKYYFDAIQSIEYFRINELFHETLFRYMYKLAKLHRLRFTNSISYDRPDHFYRYYNSIAVLHKYKRTTSFTYSLTASGKSDPTYHYTNYSMATQMRRLIHRDYLFLDFSVGFKFPKDIDFDPRGFVVGGIEVFL